MDRMQTAYRRLGLLVVFVVGIVVVAGGALFWDLAQKQRIVANRSKCNGHLCFISLAMHNYHDANGHLPPAYVNGPDGKPWHSWRVLLLPYIEEDKLYREFKFDEPWDGPNNRKLQSRMPKCYACPGDSENLKAGRTNYFVVVGPETAFPGAKSTKFEHITRPKGETILLVESIRQDINWMEPRDLAFENLIFHLSDTQVPSISSKHRAHNVAMVDGSRRTVHGISPVDLRTMFLIREFK